MRDIVATIQADQYGLITRDPEGILIVQGGPGTGKTAVGLHRASSCSTRTASGSRRVLVVGPNPTFMEYVSHVLPALGEEAVEQRAVGELVDGLEVSAADAPEVERLKGDVRLAEVVARGDRRCGRSRTSTSSGSQGESSACREPRPPAARRRRAELGLPSPRASASRCVLRRFYEAYGRSSAAWSGAPSTRSRVCCARSAPPARDRLLPALARRRSCGAC